MTKTDKEILEDGCEAFYEGFDLEDNPWPEFDHRFDPWDRDFLECAKNYREEGRARLSGYMGDIGGPGCDPLDYP